jgi:hypothetical protein
VLHEYKIGASTRERANIETQHVNLVSSGRLREMILKFYETKLASRGEAHGWKILGENGERLLATMYNI